MMMTTSIDWKPDKGWVFTNIISLDAHSPNLCGGHSYKPGSQEEQALLLLKSGWKHRTGESCGRV